MIKTEYGFSPESLAAFQDIVISDKRINVDEHLVELANIIQESIDKQNI